MTVNSGGSDKLIAAAANNLSADSHMRRWRQPRRCSTVSLAAAAVTVSRRLGNAHAADAIGRPCHARSDFARPYKRSRTALNSGARLPSRTYLSFDCMWFAARSRSIGSTAISCKSRKPSRCHGRSFGFSPMAAEFKSAFALLQHSSLNVEHRRLLIACSNAYL